MASRRSLRLQGPITIQGLKKRKAAEKVRNQERAAVAKLLDSRHFEHREHGTSKPATASNLNKLFDEYRGMLNSRVTS